MQGGFEEFLLVQSHCFLSSYFSQGPGCTLCWAVPEMGQPRGPRVLAALQIEMPEVLSNFPLWLPGHCSFQQLMPDVRLELESYLTQTPQTLTPTGGPIHSCASICIVKLCPAPAFSPPSALMVQPVTLPPNLEIISH